MARALAIRYVDVGADERAPYLARLAERTASARAVGYHLWAFERQDASGRFVEFVETAGHDALTTALMQDALLAESLDFRIPPAAAEQGSWERYDGLAGAS